MAHSQHTKQNKKASDCVADPENPGTWSKPPGTLFKAVTQAPPGPIDGRSQTLPFANLAWEDFERLCTRLLRESATLLHWAPYVRRYGRSGQRQEGIDVFGRTQRSTSAQADVDRPYVCLQARRIQVVTAKALIKAVDDFLAGHWARKSHSFIYATSASADDTAVQDAIELQINRLAAEGITFEVWDAAGLFEQLKINGAIIHDFFGRHWLEAVLGTEASTQFTTRMDVEQVLSLRRKLRSHYESVFAVADPGLLPTRKITGPPTPFHERYIVPTVLPSSAEDNYTSPQWRTQSPRLSQQPSDLSMTEMREYSASQPPKDPVQHTVLPSPSLLAHDWLAIQSRQIVVGDPGAGKSALLRFLVLDILSDAPRWPGLAERWGDRIPVWIPFHFLTRIAAEDPGRNTSLSSSIRRWIEHRDGGDLWPLVEQALEDERLLLVVDGLDEWVSEAAGQCAVESLNIFLSGHKVAAVVSSRPYGLRRLSLGPTWQSATIAPLSREQQSLLARQYFATMVSEIGTGVIDTAFDQFFADLDAASDLRGAAGTPLIFILLIGLFLASGRLVGQRFRIYAEVVKLLIQSHPAKRRSTASVASHKRALSDDQVFDVLARIAFAQQMRGGVLVIDESVLKRDVALALQSPDMLAMTPHQAATTAQDFTQIAEGELGILVRSGPHEFVFLHRALQEHLAAAYASRLPEAEQLELIRNHIGNAAWLDVLAGMVWLLTRPEEHRRAIKCIQSLVNDSVEGMCARELLADLLFAAECLPGNLVPTLATDIFDTIVTHRYSPHRQRLLERVVGGLGQSGTHALVAQHLERWALVTEYCSADIIDALAGEPPESQLNPMPSLLAALRHPNEAVVFAAAIAIARRSTPVNMLAMQSDSREELLLRLRLPATANEAAGALLSLLLACGVDESIDRVVEEGRRSQHETMRLIALAYVRGVMPPLWRAHEVAKDDVAGKPLSSEDDAWLEGFLERRFSDLAGIAWTMLVKLLAHNVRRREDFRTRCKEFAGSREGNRNLAWAVLLEACPNDDDVVTLVADEIRRDQYLHTFYSPIGIRLPLGETYEVGKPNNQRIAEAIESHIASFGAGALDVYLPDLCRVCRGPNMKALLLKELASDMPHWAARCLAEHFSSDAEARDALRQSIEHDDSHALAISYQLRKILGLKEGYRRIRQAMEACSRSGGHIRWDFAVGALADMFNADMEEALSDKEEAGRFCLSVLRSDDEWVHSAALWGIAIGFKGTAAGSEALDRLAVLGEVTTVGLLRATVGDGNLRRTAFERAHCLVSALPLELRASISEYLGHHMTEQNAVRRILQEWPSDIERRIKSSSSVAYHRAVGAARRAGVLSDDEWKSVLERLQQQASCYGPDHDARRRAAWIGLLITEQWKVVRDVKEGHGDPTPISTSMSDTISGPDRWLAQEVAMHWRALARDFGADLESRLTRKHYSESPWSSLATVAELSPDVSAELWRIVSSDRASLQDENILGWYVRQPQVAQSERVRVLKDGLSAASSHVRPVAAHLLARPNEVGLSTEEVVAALEPIAYDGNPWGNPRLEIVAEIAPTHEEIQRVWRSIEKQMDVGAPVRMHPRTFAAISLCACPANYVLRVLERIVVRYAHPELHFFAGVAVRYATARLVRDADAKAMVLEGILDSTMPDGLVASLCSIVAHSIDGGTRLATELERRRRACILKNVGECVMDFTTGNIRPADLVFLAAQERAWLGG